MISSCPLLRTTLKGNSSCSLVRSIRMPHRSSYRCVDWNETRTMSRRAEVVGREPSRVRPLRQLRLLRVRPLEKAQAIAAFGLGAIQREVGMPEQFVEVEPVLRRDRDADADGETDLLRADAEWLGHGIEQPVGEDARRA